MIGSMTAQWSECRWRERILAGQCRVNGDTVCDPEYRLTSPAVLRYERPPWAEPPAPAHLDVLYLDGHGVVAIAKPSGLQVLAVLGRAMRPRERARSGSPRGSCLGIAQQRFFCMQAFIITKAPEPVGDHDICCASMNGD